MINNKILQENPLRPFFWEYKGNIYLKDIDNTLKAQRFVDFWPEIEQLFRKKIIDIKDIQIIINIIYQNIADINIDNDMVKFALYFLLSKFKLMDQDDV